MQSANCNITVQKGCTLRQLFQIMGEDGVTPLNLTDYTFRAKLADDLALPTVTFDLTPTVVDVDNGIFQIYLTKEQTATIAFKTGWYDVVMVTPAPTSDTVRLIQGYAYVEIGVTA